MYLLLDHQDYKATDWFIKISNIIDTHHIIKLTNMTMYREEEDYWFALTIWMKSFLRLAPPTRDPSMSGH